MKKISICIPVYNEEENIIFTYKKIKEIFENQLKNYDYEIIFTDNNSKDNTESIITEICKNNVKVKYIRFKSNLEYDKSILEGYKHSSGDAAIVIDCDLQDPPELFYEFIKKWETGDDLVYGEVKTRKESLIENTLRKIFYFIMKHNTDISYPLNAHDFRLVDRKILNELKNINNLFPYVRGLTFSLASKPSSVKYDRSLRERGKSKLGFYKSFNYAINAFLEETFIFSKIFRRLSLFLVFFILIFTIINVFNSFSIISFIDNIYFVLLIFICSFLSIICEYTNRIYFQIKKTKREIYEKQINL